jgi:MSHA biogenesis protein MshO
MAKFDKKSLSQPLPKPISKALGFTLVELVIVIVISGILAVVVAPIVSGTFANYTDTSRRVVLVDAAEASMRQITKDIRDAIPNTLRTNGTVIELMPIREGGRYRYSDTATDNTALTPGALDSQFRMLGNMTSLPANSRVVVYNTGATQFYLAATSGGLGIITPTSTTVSLTDTTNTSLDDEDTLALSAAFQFDSVGTGSPAKRFYIATSPVTYHCDTGLGTIVRYEGYSTAISQPTSRSSTPLSTATSSAVLVNNVSACSFSYTTGSNSRAGLLVMEMTITIDGEFINLLHQVHLGNAP